MADELRLKVSRTEYANRIGTLDSKITAIDTLIGEYQNLRTDATRVLGEGDSNLQKLWDSIETNMKAVQGQRQLLHDSREMLQKQMEALGILSTDVNTMFDNGLEAAKTMFNTIKTVGGLVN